MREPTSLRRLLRDFLNESNLKVSDKETFVGHLGNDEFCDLCKIEKRYIRKIRLWSKSQTR